VAARDASHCRRNDHHHHYRARQQPCHHRHRRRPSSEKRAELVYCVVGRQRSARRHVHHASVACQRTCGLLAVWRRALSTSCSVNCGCPPMFYCAQRPFSISASSASIATGPSLVPSRIFANGRPDVPRS